jgi:succinyl-diaminopimelate desuccinylase
MSAERVAGALRDHPDELLATTRRLVAADTQNPPGETRAPAEWLMDELEGLGLDCERFCVDPEKPNLVATLPGERASTLLYNGHLDTVPFDASEWSHDPLGEVVDDRLYGRGATDMKGAIGAMVQVARAFVRTGTTPPVTLQFAFVSDEEVAGDAGLSTRLKTNRLDPDACVIGEATGRPDVNSIAVGDRGLVWPTVSVEGQAAHGSRPMFGTNAIDRLYEYVDTCRTRLAEFEVPTEPFDDQVIDESIAYYAHQMSEDAATALFRHPTVNLGRIEGGEAVNSVPVRAEASLDLRFLPSVDPEDVLAELRDCTFGQEGATVGDITWTEGTYTEPTTDLVRAATEAAEATFSTPVYRRFATGSGDAQAFREQGIPTIEFATGTGTVHATDEYTSREKLLENALAYARLPFELDRLRETG